MRSAEIILLLVFPLVLLCGCTGAANLDEQVYPLMMGIDLCPDGAYYVSIKLPALPQGQGEDKTIGAKGATVFSAIGSIDILTPQRLSFYQLKYIVFSEELAFSDDFFDLCQSIAKLPGLKPGADCFISQGSAKDFLTEMKPFMGENLSKTVKSMDDMLKSHAYIPDCNFFAMVKELNSPYGTPLAILCAPFGSDESKSSQLFQGNAYPSDIQSDQQGAKVLGSVVLGRKSAVKKLTGQKNRLLLMCMGKFSTGKETYVLNDQKYDMLLKRGRITKIKTEETNGELNVFLDIRLYVFPIDTGQRPPFPTEEAAEIFAGSIQELLTEIYSLGADPLMLGGQLARKYPTIESFESADVLGKLTDAKFTVTVYIQPKEGYSQN